MIATLQSQKSYLPETNAVAAAFSTPPTAERLALINVTIAALISAGIWQLDDLFYMLAAADSQAGTINWRNPGTNTLTIDNSATFTADRGFTGDGVSMSLTAAYTNVLYLRDNGHIAAFGLTATASSVPDFTLTTITPGIRGQARLRTTTGGAGSAGASTVTTTGSTAAAPRLLAANRDNDASNQVIYVNGAEPAIGAVASAASAIVAATFLGNGAGSYADRQIAFGACGASLTADQHASLNTIVRAYLTGVGAI